MDNNQEVAKSIFLERVKSSIWSFVLLRPVIMSFSVAGSAIVARILGPELLAIVTAINAVSATLMTFLDFGITRSISKIIPDMAVQFGKERAYYVRQYLLWVKLIILVFGLLVLMFLDYLGFWRGRENLNLGIWFFPLVAMKVLLGTILTISHYMTVAAFRNKLLAQLSLVSIIIETSLEIGLVLLWPNPYTIVLVVLIVDLIQLELLRRFGGYDIDDKLSNNKDLPSWRWLARKYGRYISVTYFIFIFNRFVFGMPLLLWVMTFVGLNANRIGNVSISFSLLTQFLDVANIPLANLRAPLLARLYAIGNEEHFRKAQQMMVGIVILSSGALAVTVLSVGPIAFGLLYGQKYESGVSWGITASVISLLGNVFSMGNSTLHQRNRFLPELLGLVAAGVSILIGMLSVVYFLPQIDWSLGFVLCLVGGRILFWLLTDLWTDAEIFHWDGSMIKVRGLIASGLALTVTWALATLGMAGKIASLPLGLLIFLGCFRLLGGVGDISRNNIQQLLGPRMRWVVRYL